MGLDHDHDVTEKSIGSRNVVKVQSSIRRKVPIQAKINEYSDEEM